MPKRRSNTEEFIRRAKEIHGDKYGYDKVVYIGYYDNIIIKCSIHKYFEQQAGVHLMGSGCKQCQRDKNRGTIENFIEKANKIHNHNYDYSKVEYIDNRKAVIIICKKHNYEFSQKPISHLRGNGCRKCSNEIKHPFLTNEEVIKRIKEIHGNKYDCSKLEYKGWTEKFILICNFHKKEFKIAAGIVIGLKRGCPKCGRMKCGQTVKLTNEIVDKFLIDNNAQLIRLEDYINVQTAIKYKCLKCNLIISKKFTLIKAGKYCHKCSMRKNEKIVLEFLANHNINLEKLVIKRKDIKKSDNKRTRIYPDFYLKDYNLIIEYNGIQHYQSTKFGTMSKEYADDSFIKQKERDEFLREYCKENNIKLLEIDGREYQGDKIIKFLEEYFMIK